MDEAKKPRILGVITARGGSKSVPRKNIRPLAGRPLIAYMIEAALGSRFLTATAVSSEDAEILQVSGQHGGDKLILIERPQHLAEDHSPSLPTIVHAVEHLEKEKGHEPFTHIVMLQPTTPFIRSEDIDNALALLIEKDADTVVSVHKINSLHPIKMKRITEDGRLVQYVEGLHEHENTRQKLDPVYKRNGGIYAHRRDVVLGKGRLYGGDDVHTLPYIMSDERSIDINSIADFLAAEAVHDYLSKGGEEDQGHKK